MEPELNTHRSYRIINISAIVILVALFCILGYVYYFSRGPISDAAPETFVVSADNTGAEALAKLEKAGFVRNKKLFEAIFRSSNPSLEIAPGGYELSKAMSAFQITSKLSESPLSIWVTIPEGLRKEEIAELLTKKLNWGKDDVTGFLEAGKDKGTDYYEGVYFPETYLIPKADSGAKVAKRMMNTLNDILAKMSPALAKQNIKWTTVLKVASLVQREAASKADMPIIASVIWNRLDKKQRLEIDATVQYAKNSAPDWWAPLKSGDTNIGSPYNTYRKMGLPPTPIANPGLDAIQASALSPVSKCLYYIHDNDKTIHCATTFAEHKANIAKYLK